MTIKGFAAAHRHKGGFEQWVYDMIKELSEQTDSDTVYDDTALKARVKAVEDAIGDDDTAETIAYRVKALETAAAGSGSGSGSG